MTHDHHDHDGVHEDNHRELTTMQEMVVNSVVHELRTVDFSDPAEVGSRLLTLSDPLAAHAQDVETFRIAAHIAEVAKTFEGLKPGDLVRGFVRDHEGLLFEDAFHMLWQQMRAENAMGDLTDDEHVLSRARKILAACSEDHSSDLADPMAPHLERSHPMLTALAMASHLRAISDHVHNPASEE